MKLTHYILAVALFALSLTVTSSATVQAASIEVLGEYSREHNQVLRCITPLNTTKFEWSINGVEVFEKNADQYYNSSHTTFANYFHTFPGIGTYNVSCVASTATETDSGSRAITIATRATPEEIEGNIVVPRLSATYLDDYRVRYTCEVIGAVDPAVAHFTTEGNHSISNSTMTMTHRWEGFQGTDEPGNPSVSGSTFTYEHDLPSLGNYKATCTAGTAEEDAWNNWHNNGWMKGFSCTGGPRDGMPECNIGTDEESFSAAMADVQSGIYVSKLDADTYEARCYPRMEDSYMYVTVPGREQVGVYPGDPVLFNTTNTSFSVQCYQPNQYTSWGLHSSVNFDQEFSFASSGGETCYSHVQDAPVTCTGGSVTQDTTSGSCRTVVCTNGGSSMRVLSCNKPDGSTPQYFEMYKQSKVGAAVSEICFGDTCISDNGYDRSGNYPICMDEEPPTCTPSTEVCDSTDNDCDGQIDEGDVCEQGGGTCYNTVTLIPATCNGGSITSDTTSGTCRTIDCGSGGNTIRVFACDKPDSGTKNYFEIYKQSQSGATPRVCIGGTCIQESGYAKNGNYPICAGEEPPTCVPSTETCDQKDNDCDGQVDEGGVCDVSTQSADLSIAPWYPKGRDYVFRCVESGYDATSYFWNFGDGDTQLSTADNVYHIYDNAGNYAVTCEARGSVTKSDTVQISVS